MLKSPIIKAGTDLAVNLTASGTMLEAKNGTPLDILLGTLNPVNEATEGDLPNRVQAEARPLTAEFDPHTAELQNIVHSISSRLRDNIRFATTVVTPLCREIANKCNTALKEAETNTPINVAIRNVAPLPLFSSARIEDMIAKYSNSILPEAPLDTSVVAEIRPLLNPENIRSAITSNSDQFNTSVASLLESIELLDMQWEDFILRPAPILQSGSKEIFEDPTNILNVLFLSGIIQGRLVGFDPGTRTLNEMALVSKSFAYYANRLHRQIDAIRRMAKNKDFILPLESNRREVYVYEKMYREWLKAGGTSEALIVGVIKTSHMADLNARLHHDAETLASEYTAIARRHKATKKVELTSDYASIIENSILSHIKESDDEDKVAKMEALRDFIKTYPLGAKEDLVSYIKRAVCVSLARGTNVYVLLSAIDAYLEAMPEATVQEAAVQACVKLIAKWAALQVHAHKVNTNETIAI